MWFWSLGTPLSSSDSYSSVQQKPSPALREKQDARRACHFRKIINDQTDGVM